MRRFKRFFVTLLAIIMMCIPTMEAYAAKATYPTVDMFEGVGSIKGMQGATSKTQGRFGGLKHSLVNIHLDDAICTLDSDWAKNGWAAKYEFEGETFYFKDPAGRGFIPSCNESDMSISVVFLLRWTTDMYNNDSTFLIDPNSRVGGYNYYAPNTDLSTYGARAIRAYWHFLMEWLVDNGYHIDNFILGNEVNMPNSWHYSGSADVNTVATKYADAFYQMYSAVRKYTDVSRCSISLDHSWNNNDEGRGIEAKSFLHVFNDRLAQYESDIDWGVSLHLYPAVLYDTRIWLHPYGLTTNSSDTRIVDGTNLSAVTNYIRDNFGQEHRVMLTEQGFSNAYGAEAQAASLAYTYYAAMYDPMVDSFLISLENAGGNMNFDITGTLAEEVYTKIGNGNSQDEKWIADVCLPVIGVSSWEEIIPNYGNSVDKASGKIDYSPVFDAEYYYNNNPDIASVMDYDEMLLLKHFKNCGMSEGRTGSAEFVLSVYKENNPDVVAAFGDDNKSYYLHYIKQGKAEGRKACQEVTVTIDYSAVFDADFYYNNNADIAAALGKDKDSLLQHFVANGMNEGRQASAEFNVEAYKNNNPDVVAALGNNTKEYYLHYINCGKAEGRSAVSANSGNQSSGSSTDYSAVFSAEYYYNNNPDVAGVLGNDADSLLKHFIANGMDEGRQASAEFNVNAYKNNNPDVVAALGDNTKEYYLHYINHGKAEGRDAVTMNNDSSNSGSNTTTDYSVVFDVEYYYNNNPDVAAALGSNSDSLLQHFVANGMDEGRQGCATFNVNVYRNSNADLADAFGDNLKEYYLHYINHGSSEGRVAY